MLIRRVLALSALFVSVAASAQQQPDPLNRAIVESQSQPPSSSREPPSGHNTRPSVLDQRGTDGEPLAVKILPAPGAETKAGKDEQDRKEKAVIDEKLAHETERLAEYTRWLAAVTFALCCVAGFQAGLFVWQLRLIKQSMADATRTADAAEKAANAAVASADFIPRVERAYLTGGGDVEDIGLGERCFRLEVANYGKTPAYLSDFDVRFATFAEVEAGPKPVCCRWRFDDRIAAGDKKVLDHIAMPYDAKVIYGAFWYQDWLKREHIFRFILRVHEDGHTRTDVARVDDSYRYWD